MAATIEANPVVQKLKKRDTLAEDAQLSKRDGAKSALNFEPAAEIVESKKPALQLQLSDSEGEEKKERFTQPMVKSTKQDAIDHNLQDQ